MSFASEPGRGDDSLPPVNVVIPDDARELDRDVLAYRRELRSARRRQRLTRFLGPLGRRAALIPLIAVCLAASLVGGALLSVTSMSPALAPTTGAPPPAGTFEPTALPPGNVNRAGTEVPARSLVTAAIAIIPAHCDCGASLRRLAGQAVDAHVAVYFAAAEPEDAQLAVLTARYGDGRAVAVTDDQKVLTATFHPAGLTVLLVYSDATAELRRGVSGPFVFTPTMTQLSLVGPGAA